MRSKRLRNARLVTSTVSVLAFSTLALYAAAEHQWVLAIPAMFIALADAFLLGMRSITEWTGSE